MSTDEILAIVNSDKKGFHIGERLILPFKCNLLKLIVDNKIYTEFVGNDDVKISQEAHNTSIYFRSAGRLSSFEGSYELIKIVVASETVDLTDRKNHIKIVCHILDDREVEIELPGDDILFIE